MLDVSVDLLRPGGQVVIVYQASVPPLAAGTRLPNTAVATWTSEPGPQGTANATPGAPGSDTGERTGDVTGANDYLTSDIASVVVGAVNMTKAIVAPQARYAVGDPVTYRVDLAIPAFATLTNASVSDVLAAGLIYQPGSLTVAGSPDVIPTTLPGDFTVTTDAAGAQTLTLGFGALTNTANASRTVTLTYTVIVANVLTNQDGHVLMNQATFFFDDPGTGLPTSQLAETMLTVGEPQLALSKTITGPAVGLDAGDSVAFRVDVSNTGTTTAFDTVIADTLPLRPRADTGPGRPDGDGWRAVAGADERWHELVHVGIRPARRQRGGHRLHGSPCLRRDTGRAAPEHRRRHLHEPRRQRPERARRVHAGLQPGRRHGARQLQHDGDGPDHHRLRSDRARQAPLPRRRPHVLHHRRPGDLPPHAVPDRGDGEPGRGHRYAPRRPGLHRRQRRTGKSRDHLGLHGGVPGRAGAHVRLRPGEQSGRRQHERRFHRHRHHRPRRQRRRQPERHGAGEQCEPELPGDRRLRSCATSTPTSPRRASSR